MEYIYTIDNISVRKMMDTKSDYLLLAKWLSTPEVLDFYEGRNNPYDYDKIIKKYGPRVQGIQKVIPCIIQFDNIPVGYIQYYETNAKDYEISQVITDEEFANSFALDIFIGEISFWNKGIGTKVICGMIDYLFNLQNADTIYIDPQTWNTRAIRTYEKSGFSKVAIIENREELNGEMKDSCIMRIQKCKGKSLKCQLN